MLNEEERERLTQNIAGHIKNCAGFIQQRVVEMFGKCDPDYGARIGAQLQKYREVGVWAWSVGVNWRPVAE